MIRELFRSVDGNEKLEIHIAATSMQDFVMRHLTKTALFMVRSAYHAEWYYQFGRHNPYVMNIGESAGCQV
jgi:hypothetical protein